MGAATIAVACGVDVIGERVVIIPVDATPDVEPSLPPKPDGAPPVDAGDAAKPDCPEGLSGPRLVPVPGSDFCIDTTEVSNAQYNEFLSATNGGRLDAGIPEGGLPPRCNAARGFDRAVGALPEGGPPAHPVTYVSWCAAYAYCAWAGKRLCGNVVARDAGSGDWYEACSDHGKHVYPYGDVHEPQACNDENVVGDLEPVGSRPTCEGGVPGLFDMAGNVIEWIDDCDGPGDASLCAIVGGFHSSPAILSTCRQTADYPVNGSSGVVGFRCCTDRP
ncbi:MAG: SUMF1/EgtB/PvdO family nonheme iron enzyme [Labilithrix sp.]|nr:SUMF1/EgtB/PvdO family nonheme iron enzyme [Labilithrix sp.]